MDREKREKQIHFRVSLRQYEFINQLASTCNLTVTDYLLLRALNNDVYVAPVKNTHAILEFYSKVAELHRELKKEGVNLNQIAKIANESHDVGKDIFFETFKSLQSSYDKFNESIVQLELTARNSLNDFGKLSEKNKVSFNLTEGSFEDLDSLVEQIQEQTSDADELLAMQEPLQEALIDDEEHWKSVFEMTDKERAIQLMQKGDDITEEEALWLLIYAENGGGF